MIIIGYPGIGKTTLALKRSDVVDLESSMFNDDDSVKIPYWYKYYCNVASDLSKQGKIVMVSNHQEVVNYLTQTLDENLCFVFPSIDLKSWWISKVKQRMIDDPTIKNHKAFKRVCMRYTTDICKIINIVQSRKYGYWCIENQDYNLADIVDSLHTGYNSNNLQDCNHVCGTCANFIGCRDFNLCCKLKPGLFYHADTSCKDYVFNIKKEGSETN